jgi:hypothetical protein
MRGPDRGYPFGVPVEEVTMFRRYTTERAAPKDGTLGEDRATPEGAWSLVPSIAIAVGCGVLLLGVAGVLRTGLPFDHLDRPTGDVIAFRHSPLLGLAEIAFGTVVVLSGLVAAGARPLMLRLGTLAIGFGLMILAGVTPDRIQRWLAVGDPYGWLCVIVGVFMVLTARFLPDVSPHEQRMAHRHVRDLTA